MDTNETVVKHVYPDPSPIRMKVERNSRGVNWELSVSGKDLDDCKANIEQGEAWLRARYPEVDK